ncbi:MAG: hypothetical protein JRH11_26100 [Deltaproteobacteria bacterium]|nr:hypothetical protein [Deltaproteobacteria bacterium]
MTWSIRGALALCVLLSMSIAPARADDGGKPRSAIAISTAEGVDDFIAAYLFEVAASILRADGYDVAPANATAAHLDATGRTAAACATDDTCVADLARTLGAPTVLFIDVTRGEGAEVSVSVRGVTVRVDGVSSSEPREATGTETAMGEPIQVAAERLTDTTAPCHFEVEASGIGVTVQVDGGPEITRFPFFVEPGGHAIVVSARRRVPHEGRFTCEAGKLYRVGVR